MVVWQTKQRFCFHKVSQGSKPSLFMNLLQTWLANCCESYLVESPLLYLAFFKTILTASEFRTISLSPLFFFFLSLKPSFLDGHFSTQHSHFRSFLAVFSTDKHVA